MDSDTAAAEFIGGTAFGICVGKFGEKNQRYRKLSSVKKQEPKIFRVAPNFLCPSVI